MPVRRELITEEGDFEGEAWVIDLEIPLNEDSPLEAIAAVYGTLSEGFAEEIAEWIEGNALPFIEQAWPRSFWAKLSEATIKDKEARGYGGMPPLQRTQDMFTAATGGEGSTLEIWEDGGIFGVNVEAIPYALWHHTSTAFMPYRRWYELEEAVLEELERSLQDKLDRAVGA
jgi:hypothetical protein